MLKNVRVVSGPHKGRLGWVNMCIVRKGKIRVIFHNTNYQSAVISVSKLEIESTALAAA